MPLRARRGLVDKPAHDHLYVARGPRREPVGGHLATARAAEGILAWRWWSRRELSGAPGSVWPPELPRLLTEFEESERSQERGADRP